MKIQKLIPLGFLWAGACLSALIGNLAAAPIIHEPFAYTVGTNNADPDGGLNVGNGLPATNFSGTPSGTSTGLRGAWGIMTDTVAGLNYVRGSRTLMTSGGAARINNATWGSNPFVYRSMTVDPFISDRIAGSNSGNFGPDGTSVYLSFLGQTSSPTANAFRLSLRFDSGANFYVSNTATGWSLNGTPATNAPLALNTPTLFIVRFDFAAGAADTINLWVDPILGQPLGSPNAVVSNFNFPGLGNFQTNAAVANAMTFDEIRVATSLADVTPHSDTAALPVITSSLSQSGTATGSFSYTITATNNPTSYGASNLPAGLTLNTTTGLISGAPTTAGTYNTTITATNPAGTTPATLVLNIAPVMPNSYYVSPNGNNNNNGSSPGQAWQTLAKVNSTNFAAGKTIYFEGGKTFAGTLTISSSGTAASPITYSSYGTGRATISSGAGAISGLTSSSKSNVTIQNLNFTGVGYTSNTAIGMSFFVTSNSNVSGIKINQVDVSGYGSFGIRFHFRRSGSSKYGYRDVQITNSKVFDNKDSGLITSTAWTKFSTFSHGNFLIQDSSFYKNRGYATANSSGNGICLADMDGAVIERCVAYQNGLECTATGGGPVGIWSWDSNNVIIQQCEAYKNGNGGSYDGGGFDIDGGNTNCIIQYCYSHENQGAGYLIAQFLNASRPMKNNVIRYNLSVNDATLGNARNQGSIHVWNAGGNTAAAISDTFIYGNTVYQAVGPDALRTADTATTNTRIFNNILVATNGKATARIQQTGGVSLQGNLYYGSAGAFGVNWGGTAVSSLAAFQNLGQEKNGAILLGVHADPLLISPGNVPTFNSPAAHATWTAYQVSGISPAREAGLSVTGLIGASTGSLPGISHPGSRDFWGTSMPQNSALDIGAFERPFYGQTITFAPLANKLAGDAPFNLVATASSGLTVSFASSNPSIATVSGNTVTIVGTGTATITAFQAGNFSYAAAPTVARTLQVNATATHLEGTPAALTGTNVGDGSSGAATVLSINNWWIDGAGSGIEGTADSFHFESRAITGDAQVLVGIRAIASNGATPRAGIMLRETTVAGSRYVMVAIPASNTGSYFYGSRAVVDEASAETVAAGPGSTYSTPDAWMILQRRGDVVTIASATGSNGNYSNIGQVTLPGLSGTLQGGVFSSSGTAGEFTRAEMTGFEIIPLDPLP